MKKMVQIENGDGNNTHFAVIRVHVFKNLVSQIFKSALGRRVQLLMVPLIVWYNVSNLSRLVGSFPKAFF